MGRTQRWMVVTLAGALGCGGSSESQPGTMMAGGGDGTGSPTMGNTDPGAKPAGGNATTSPAGNRRSEGASGVKNSPAPVGQVATALRRVDSCEELLTRIQDDVAAKVELQAELMRKEPEGGGFPGGPVFVGGARGSAEAAGAIPPGAPTPDAVPRPSAMAPSDPTAGGTSAGAKDSSAPTDFSETNTQVKGVDEADIVKTDGQHIYLLHGNVLFVFDSWPAAETAVRQQIQIEGYVQEMFVHEGRAVVFSRIYDQGELGQPAADAKLARPYYGGATFTKITVVNTATSRPTTERQIFVEGDYLSARRHGETVRAVIQDPLRFPDLSGGYIEYRDQFGRPYSQERIDAQVDAWRDRTIAALEDTSLADWLPVEHEVKEGKLVATKPRCDDFYTPAAGLARGGLSNVLSFDLTRADSELGGAMVLGMADEVYANDTVLVLAHRDWRFDQKLIERERTVLHRFEMDGASTVYTASGLVPGHIIDQFSIDEQDGVIRVATTARFWPDFRPLVPGVAEAAAADDAAQNDPDAAKRMTDNRVVTLGVDGSELKRLGITKPLGKDGEVIQSSRFVNDRAYVVTFERIDPLIVVDLAKPESPSVLGQLSIPGFSEYMHPIDDGHLVTIGQDADTSGRVTGLLLQIFDVTDATKPRRTHSFRFGPNGYSEANQNHKAFTFFKPQGAEGFDGLLAFPYVNYNGEFQSTLQVFEVSIDSGFTQLGTIDHTQLLRNVCQKSPQPQPIDGPVFSYCVQPEVRRGLFIFGDEGDFVYSVSNGGVEVHDMGDLVRPVASVELPYPDQDEHRVFGLPVPGAMGGPGSVGTEPAPPPRPMP